jgi:hypothetical protein
MLYFGCFYHNENKISKNCQRFNMAVNADNISEASDMFEEALMTSMDKSLEGVEKIFLSSITEISDNMSYPIIFNHENFVADKRRRVVVIRDTQDDSANGVKVYINEGSSEPFVERI